MSYLLKEVCNLLKKLKIAMDRGKINENPTHWLIATGNVDGVRVRRMY